MHHSDELQAQIDRLSADLETRDLLLQQLSEELLRLAKIERSSELPLLPPPTTLALSGNPETDPHQLRQELQLMTERCRALEQVVRDLPQIYRRKFMERMAIIKEKVSALQAENFQLRQELQSIGQRVSIYTLATPPQLPNLPRPPG